MFNLIHLLCRSSDEKNPRKVAYKFSNQKLKELGFSFTTIEDCLAEMVGSLREKGFISKL